MDGTFENAALPTTIRLYDGTAPADRIDTEALAAFLRDQLPPAAVEVRGDFLSHRLGRRGDGEPGADDPNAPEAIAERLARAKVRWPDRRDLSVKPMYGEIGFEKRFLLKGGAKPAGILYDGNALGAIFTGLLPPEERSTAICPIAITNQLLGTWDGGDRRYHARVSVYGFPTLLSTTGILEGPAKPREFYLGQGVGASRRTMEEAVEGRFLRRGDPGCTEVLKGYILQALFYHVTGDPFCEDKACRLYNAHWQEEMIHAQTRPGAGLCDEHRQVLANWTGRTD